MPVINLHPKPYALTCDGFVRSTREAVDATLYERCHAELPGSYATPAIARGHARDAGWRVLHDGGCLCKAPHAGRVLGEGDR